MARPVERGGGEDEDGGVDEEGEHEGDARIDGGELDRLAAAGRRALEVARLHDGGVEIEIMGHDRRAEDADADVEHLRVGENRGMRDEAAQDAADAPLPEAGPEDLDGEADRDRANEGDDERLDQAEAAILQVEDREDVEAGDDATPDHGDAEKDFQRDGRADDLCEVAGGDGDFAEEPQEPDDRQGIAVATRLGEVASRHDAELEAQVLEQDGHEIGNEDDAEERVAELRAALEIGGPVAGVHVADGDEEAGAGEGEHLSPERNTVADGNRAMDHGERRLPRRPTPAPPGEGAVGGRKVHGGGAGNRMRFSAKNVALATF